MQALRKCYLSLKPNQNYKNGVVIYQLIDVRMEGRVHKGGGGGENFLGV
jgi:hypothetical protein